MILGCMAMGVVCVVLVSMEIHAGGKKMISQAIQRIILNFFQVASMAATYPLRWPPLLESLFTLISGFGDWGFLVNPDCVTHSSAANIFYSKRIFFAVLPFIVVAVSFAVWYVYGWCKGKPFFAKRPDEDSSTPKDFCILSH